MNNQRTSTPTSTTPSIKPGTNDRLIDITMTKISKLKSAQQWLKHHAYLAKEDRTKYSQLTEQIKDTQAFLDKLLTITGDTPIHNASSKTFRDLEDDD